MSIGYREQNFIERTHTIHNTNSLTLILFRNLVLPSLPSVKLPSIHHGVDGVVWGSSQTHRNTPSTHYVTHDRP